MTGRIFILLTLFFLVVASGCKKNRNPHFPNIGFEEYIYLNNPTNSALQHPGGWVYHPGGYKGLIVYRRHIQNRQEDFVVYDRGCPSHYDRDCGTLEVSDDDIFAGCGCEDEEYLLMDGSPAEGANLPLVQYRASLNSGVLYVHN